MKKILIVTSSLQAGGAERVVSILSSAWAEKGYQVTLVTTFLDETSSDFYEISEKINRIKLCDHCNATSRGFIDYLSRMLSFRRLIKKERPNIVISFIDRINVMTLIALWGTKTPVVVSERIDPFEHSIGNILGWIRPIVYRRAVKVLAQTELVAKKMENVWKLRGVEAIPNPLSNDLPPPKVWSHRQNIILSVGRLDKQKGHDLLIAAWARIQSDFPCWKLRIIGEGNERTNLEAQISSLNLDCRVEMPGLVFPIWSEYQKAKIFVLGSRYEGFPNALLEAMAMGCAVVSTKCPSGPEDIVCDNENGKLVSIGVESLACGMKSLIVNNKKQIAFSNKSIGIREKYSLAPIVSEWEHKVGIL